MGQINSKFRSTINGIAHWCPGCEEMHVLPLNRGWTFNGNHDCPTFTPSFLHTFNRPPEEDGPEICHYILTDGVLNFCGDCTHSLAGRSVPLPDLPTGCTDSKGDLP
jgi:hypothetical protein